MQDMGRRYVQYVNRTYCRSGGLWEGRYKASLVQSDRYLLTCMRYVELNPVQANMVIAPGEYRWSSYRANALGAEDPVVTPHGEYLALGPTGEARQLAYRSLFAGAIDEQDCLLIRAATQQGVLVGDRRFAGVISARLGPAGAARPAWSTTQGSQKCKRGQIPFNEHLSRVCRKAA